MLRDALFLARKDLRWMFRERATWLWTFVMPIVFFYFIGTITGGFSGPADNRDPLGVLAPADAGFLVDRIEERLREQSFRLERVKTEAELARFRRRLRFPAGFTATVTGGHQATVQLERTGSGAGVDYDTMRVTRAVYGVLADIVGLSREGKKATPEEFVLLASKPRLVALDVKSAGRRRESSRQCRGQW